MGENDGVRRWKAKSVAYDLRWGEEGKRMAPASAGFGGCESVTWFWIATFCWEIETNEVLSMMEGRRKGTVRYREIRN